MGDQKSPILLIPLIQIIDNEYQRYAYRDQPISAESSC